MTISEISVVETRDCARNEKWLHSQLWRITVAGQQLHLNFKTSRNKHMNLPKPNMAAVNYPSSFEKKNKLYFIFPKKNNPNRKHEMRSRVNVCLWTLIFVPQVNWLRRGEQPFEMFVVTLDACPDGQTINFCIQMAKPVCLWTIRRMSSNGPSGVHKRPHFLSLTGIHLDLSWSIRQLCPKESSTCLVKRKEGDTVPTRKEEWWDMLWGQMFNIASSTVNINTIDTM